MFNDMKLGPMLLKEIERPFNNENFRYEIKFDGIRALIHVSKNSFKIVSRNHKDITKYYPELIKIKQLVGDKKVIFDGEIIALDKGKPSFQRLQARSHLKEIGKDELEDNPVYFIAFDILYQNGDLTKETLKKRKEYLNKYKDNEVFIKTKEYQNGKELFKKIKKLGLEGIVAKDINSIYYPNKREDVWLKIKNIKDGLFYVHGYVFNKEKYSLYLGEYKDNLLYYVGKVSISPKNTIINKLKKLKKVKNSFVNFKEEGTYIEVKEKVLVTFLEKTKEGKLRHPALK